ncbi:hypothetical protein F511_38978 [Dorcoceras hygrometricum]|uniref:CCHC-type domain-containing protein n=1 Tax=Dorcoceras hygrometricum TaxID=472368 RepID=A0A2Z7ARK7_9LAMI|nr:hypothetical protein F511_38978 [Dorcoceras hygrometricum]
MFKMNVRLSVPRTYREAVDRALQIERDWKDVDEERQQKRQAFQQKDQRPFKKQNKNHQRPQEQNPLLIQPISSVPAGNNRTECPKCHKNHLGQYRLGQNVCYKCGMPGHILKNCPKLKQLVTSRAFVMTAEQAPPDSTVVTGEICWEKRWRIRIPLPEAQRKNKNLPGKCSIHSKKSTNIHRAAVDRQSGPRPDSIFLQSACTRKLMDFSRTETPLHDGRNKSDEGRRVEESTAARGGREEKRGIQLAVGPQPLWLRNHNFGLAQRIIVKRLATLRHDPLGITDSACKNQLVVVSVQYGPFNTYIPIRSTTIGKSRVAKDMIAMHTSWRLNSDITSVTSIGYPRMRASGESSTTKHRLLHASGPHPIPPPNDPKTNQYNQDLGVIHSTNGNHLESPNEGSSIDHQVTIHLHAQKITMFLTNETWYFASQILVSSSGGLILILTAQSTRNEFRIHSDY